MSVKHTRESRAGAPRLMAGAVLLMLSLSVLGLAPAAGAATGAIAPAVSVGGGAAVGQTVSTGAGVDAPFVAAIPLGWHWWGYSYGVTESQVGKFLKIVGASGASSAAWAAACAAGVITFACSLPFGTGAIAAAVVYAFIDLCDWNGRGINVNIPWSGFVIPGMWWCSPR